MKTGQMLFVCGFPSGGTDLMKTVLNAHPDIYINGEMPFLKNIVEHGYDQKTKFTSLREINEFQAVLKDLDPWNNIENGTYDFSAELEASSALRLDEVLSICFSSRERHVWGNKTPQNTENLDVLATLFPQARFLIVVRDVRDVCLSWHNKWGKDMIWCADKWANRMTKGWEATRRLPSERYLFVRFEDLLTDTEAVCRSICRFLGITFSTKMLEHHKYVDRKLDGKLNYGRPIKPDNKGKWRECLADKTVRRIEEIALSTMRLFDYTPVLASTTRPITRWEIGRGRCNDAAALLLVGNRASAQNSLAQRVKKVRFELRKRILN